MRKGQRIPEQHSQDLRGLELHKLVLGINCAMRVMSLRICDVGVHIPQEGAVWELWVGFAGAEE